ncbi:hypothetical protein [Mesomycoplasma neurolyticum]|nr:hypothetical protein [Mesomycoplasma neurolyticum]
MFLQFNKKWILGPLGILIASFCLGIVLFLFIFKLFSLNNYKTWKEKILFLSLSLFFVYKNKIKNVKINKLFSILILLFSIMIFISIFTITFRFSIIGFFSFLHSDDHISWIDPKTRMILKGRNTTEQEDLIEYLKYIVEKLIPRVILSHTINIVFCIYTSSFLINIIINHTKQLVLSRNKNKKQK